MERSELAAGILVAHKMLCEFRTKLRQSWPTPDTLDSLRFAYTEMAEAMQEQVNLKVALALQDATAAPLAFDLAVVKAGNIVDGNLRLNPTYSRNRDKGGIAQIQAKLQDELTDCAMMLLTALGEKWVPPAGWYDAVQPTETIDTLALDVGNAIILYQCEADFGLHWQRDVYNVLFGINGEFGGALAQKLWVRLTRIEARIAAAAMPTPRYLRREDA